MGAAAMASSRSRSESVARRRVVLAVVFLVPSLIILWLHQSLNVSFSLLVSDQQDNTAPKSRQLSSQQLVYQQLYPTHDQNQNSPHRSYAEVPESHRPSRSRNETIHQARQISAAASPLLHKSQDHQYQNVARPTPLLPKRNNSNSNSNSNGNSTSNTTNNTNNSINPIPNKTTGPPSISPTPGPKSNTSTNIPTETNKPNNITNTNTNSTKPRGELNKKSREQRQRLRQQKLRRQRQRREENNDDEEYRNNNAWIRHPENITSFKYIPVGKYATRSVLARQKRRPQSIPLNTTASQTSNTTTTTSPYAYAFVMGGVNEQDGNYRGMLYNILIAAYILEKEGSSNDVVVYVQMSANSTLTELPPEDARLLGRVGVKIKYLPKPQVENFHQVIMQKLVVLDLVEYRRVLFLDADVMPLCNLDYVFHLSDGRNRILKPNLIIALSGSPANAGYFMLSPKPGELAQLQAIVAKQQEKAKVLPYPHFDEKNGWGHMIRPPDMWWTINKRHKRRVWKFVGSHADQGLLYHWVKYVKRSVSIVSGEEVDNYGPAKGPTKGRDKIELEETLVNPFDRYTCLPRRYEDTFGELPTYDAQGMAPYRDFIHFLGSNKPWKRRLPPPVATNIESETPYQYWFFMLRLLNKELNMGIDFANWRVIKKTPLGSLPKKDLMVALMDANQTLLLA